MPAPSMMRTGGVSFAALFLAVPLLLAQEDQTKIKNVRPPEVPVESGQGMYHAYCAVCHGTDGKGGGPAAVALKEPVPDLTTLAQHNGGKYPAMHVVSVLRFGAENYPAHGTKEMPIWGPVFASMPRSSGGAVTLRINNLTDYIGTLQAK